LQDYEWILWIDADAFIMNLSVTLKSFMAPGVDLRIVSEPSPRTRLNTGVFLIRNSAWSTRLLSDAWTRNDLAHSPFWEQDAFKDILLDGDGGAAANVLLESFQEPRLQSYPMERADMGRVYQPGDFIVHFSGGSDTYYGNQRFERALETVYRADGNTPVLAHREDLGEYLNALNLKGRGVEVGVADGLCSSRILEKWRGECLYLVDAWRHLLDYEDVANGPDAEHEDRYQQVVRRLAPYGERSRIIRATSEEAARQFPDGFFDFAYIDANHSYEAVKADLRIWFPKVKACGLFCGHDYLDGTNEFGHFGVQRAVDEFAEEKGLEVRLTLEQYWKSWYVAK